MNNFFTLLLFSSLHLCVFGAVLSDDASDSDNGLYNRTDNVVILSKANFEEVVFSKKHAWVIEFYNRYCGYCKAFAPEFKALAASIIPWSPIIKLGVIDCADNENNAVCRNYEIMSFPSSRYFHENYVKSNSDLGYQLKSTHKGEELKRSIIVKMQNEQKDGQLKHAPNLLLNCYASYDEAIENTPQDILYTFLVFVNEDSTVASEIILDLNDYPNIVVKRVDKKCGLAQVAGVKSFPGLVVIEKSQEHTNLTPKHSTKEKIFRELINFLTSKSFIIPKRHALSEETVARVEEEPQASKTDVIYYSDLERTLKFSLENEITRYRVLKGEALHALINYLNILINTFPFSGQNLRELLIDLKNEISSKHELDGSMIFNTVKRLEVAHPSAFSAAAENDYEGCKGSQSQYRGYSCGLWTLFHTLTVNAALLPGTEGPEVLRAMHGYIKYFYTCSECSSHFLEMAEKNKIFDVTENDKAVLWVWVAHNEVNLRLAGDVTEDPKFPKIQFPSKENCEDCRRARGAWYLPGVYDYLLHMYGANNIRNTRPANSTASAPGGFFTMRNIGLLSLLYLLTSALCLLFIKFVILKRILRKPKFKRRLGKV